MKDPLTIAEFQKAYFENAPKDHMPLFAADLEISISLDGCLMAKYGDEFVPMPPHDGEEDWARDLAFILQWLKKLPRHPEELRRAAETG